MPRFLSPEWFERATAAAAGAPPFEHEAGTEPVAVRNVILDGPEGTITYVVRVGKSGLALESEDTGPADVEVTQSYATASAISRGELTPAAAFGAGRLKLGGRIGLLVKNQSVFAELAEVFGALRAETTY
ncbi:MAG: SCP2 sterol-binding domain-containing protein [Acidimicrobiales bacterium]